MAYTNVWDDTLPTGSEAANTLDDIIRSLKVDVEQRFEDIFAMPNFTDDPLRPYGLKFTDVQDAVISLGDNAGTARNLLFKNKAASATYLQIKQTGLVITPATITTASNALSVAQTWNNAAVAFTGVLLNFTDTASSASSLILDLQIGGSSKFSVKKDGLITGAAGITISSGTAAFQAITGTTGVLSSTFTFAGNGKLNADATYIYVTATDGTATRTIYTKDIFIVDTGSTFTGWLNQAVKTSSSPTFVTLTATTLTSSGTVNLNNSTQSKINFNTTGGSARGYIQYTPNDASPGAGGYFDVYSEDATSTPQHVLQIRGADKSVTIYGTLQLGSAYVAGAPAATGYILMKDSTGTSYKFLVST